MQTRDFDAETAKLATIPFSTLLRPYQREANQAIEELIRQRKRKLLVPMATGTGKTVMTVSEIYRLMKSAAAPRTLFLFHPPPSPPHPSPPPPPSTPHPQFNF